MIYKGFQIKRNVNKSIIPLNWVQNCFVSYKRSLRVKLGTIHLITPEIYQLIKCNYKHVIKPVTHVFTKIAKLIHIYQLYYANKMSVYRAKISTKSHNYQKRFLPRPSIINLQMYQVSINTQIGSAVTGNCVFNSCQTNNFLVQ